MSRNNLPILYRNIMDGLPSDFARDAFLWATERPGEDCMCYRAEAFAREADFLAKATKVFLDAAAWCAFKNGGRILDEEQTADLTAFIHTRHANWRFGGNVHPAYAVNQ